MNTADNIPELSPPTEDNARLRDAVRPEGWENPRPDGRYHLLVIGAGTAGLVAAAGAAGLGARVALVERKLLGGDCLNAGCVPSKGVIAASRAAAAARGAGRFGVSVGEVDVDFTEIMDRMRRLRADIAPNDSARRFASLGVDVYLGDARFDGEGRIAVTGEAGDRVLTYRRAMIATGARPAKPSIDGIDTVDFLTNETVFSLTEPPASLAVLGAGPIGCELAQAMARLGVAVTVFADPSGVLPNDEPDAGAIVRGALQRDGVTVRKDGRAIAVRPADGSGGVVIDGPEGVTNAERLLVAVGRVPNVEGIGLDSVGVEADERTGVLVDGTVRTTNRRIFAAGDVASARRFTHLADFQARAVVRNALMPWPLNRARGPSLAVPWATYTSPEVAGVGLTTAEADRRGVAYDTYRVELADVDRAILEGETAGFVQALTAKGTDAVIGATIVAPHAGELIGELSLAMTHGLGLGKIGAAIHPYPTVGESIRKLGDQYGRTRLTPAAKGVFRRWFAWTR